MQTTTPPNGRRPGLAGVFEIVARRRALAILPFLFVITAAASLAFFLPGLWTGKAMILVDRQQIPEAFVRPTVNSDIDSQLYTLSQEIMSRPRLLRIAEDYQLYPDLRGTRSADELVERMRKDIKLEFQSEADRARRTTRDSKSIAFTVAYTANHPQVAMDVTNRLASLYVEENLRYRERQAVGTSEFLETQLTEVRARLQNQERRIAEYKERFLGELPEQRDNNLRTLERLQQQLQIAYENNRRANERKQLITRSLAEIDPGSGAVGGGAGGPVVSAAEATAARLNLLRQELAQAEVTYGPRYPDLIALKEQIKNLEKKLAADRSAVAKAAAAAAPKKERELRVIPQNPYIQSMMAQLDQANVDTKTTTEEIAGLNRQIAVYSRRLDNTPKREQELALITRDYETTRELFRSLLGKRGEAEIAADLEQRRKGEHFRIIEPAALPERPAGPNRLRLLLLGAVLATGASVLAVVIAEQVDTSYRTVEEIRATAPVPVLSTIPRIVTEGDRVRSMHHRRLATAAAAVGLLLIVGSSFAVARNNYALVGLLSPGDGLAAKR
jgi:polysaccharide chain length determinant protein (PEP-CTERM system associated)